jgi:hypothetical protein
MEEVKDNKKELSLIQKIMLSVFIFIGVFITFSLFILSFCSIVMVSHGHGNKKNSIIEKIMIGSLSSILPSIPGSFIILILLNINIDYQFNLINYLKCLLFMFIILFLAFYYMINK